MNPTRRFEMNQKKKAHDMRIRNAKASIPQPKKAVVITSAREIYSRQESVEGECITDVLKKFNLHQYARKLIEFGYENRLGDLGKLKKSDLEGLYLRIKVFPGHKSRFIKLIDHLRSLEST